MATCTPTDQTATAGVSLIAPSSLTTFDDECLPAPCTGSQDNVQLLVNYSLEADKTGATSTAVGKIQYSTNSGGSWSDLEVVTSIGGPTTKSGSSSRNLGTIDMSLVRVRAYASGSCNTTGYSEVDARVLSWFLRYGARLPIITD